MNLNGSFSSNGSTNGKHNETRKKKPILITGGAGFVGTNVAHRYLSEGYDVLIFDNLSRTGVEENLRWLQTTHGDNVQVEVSDIRDRESLRACVRRAGAAYHFAAQVAVTTSLLDPVTDFQINALGTLNLLEEIRSLATPIPLIFTSTNKVYGGLEDVPLALDKKRYQPIELQVRSKGIGEDRPLDFHSPYGCSKGTADQYILDYARTYGIPAVVFRMSCIYGPHQFGNEDQGWVAHFLIKALNGDPITLYGDGMQVRDVLFVEDLVEAFRLTHENIFRLAGNAYNIGGGPKNTTSLLELLDRIESLTGARPNVSFSDWRCGDQRYYVSNTAKFENATGWQQLKTVDTGVEALHDWLVEYSPIVGATKTAKKVRLL